MYFQLVHQRAGVVCMTRTRHTLAPEPMRTLRSTCRLSLTGIGAELTTEDDYTKVSRLIPGGPADLQGVLRAEDKIVGVGQAEDANRGCDWLAH